ncbi:DUF2388 domain-containing protein [Pseudomonas mangiferae]|uniref:DUF2388 domain-containing protein n=1 Tax=Pseudomonas mangiferae TaxID=2593654 RepID=A0A553GV40_9PSED|nr:DUF2388 domain-containing protein [Pseudomonas mangiferae]TRX73398.1 DUF2388 domain-containing protein [Pseudomonas mangiferae]
MTPFRLLAAAVLLGLATGASASSLVGTTDTLVNALQASSDALSDVTSSLRDDKVIRAARDDAASFVASDGAIRGAHLEAALRLLRDRAPALAASDLQLAEALLVR